MVHGRWVCTTISVVCYASAVLCFSIAVSRVLWCVRIKCATPLVHCALSLSHSITSMSQCLGAFTITQNKTIYIKYIPVPYKCIYRLDRSQGLYEYNSWSKNQATNSSTKLTALMCTQQNKQNNNKISSSIHRPFSCSTLFSSVLDAVSYIFSAPVLKQLFDGLLVSRYLRVYTNKSLLFLEYRLWFD